MFKDDKIISLRLSNHAEQRARERHISLGLIINEFDMLDLDWIEKIKRWPDEEIILGNVERDIGIVFRINGYRIFIITVIGNKLKYSNFDTPIVLTDNEGEVVSIYNLSVGTVPESKPLKTPIKEIMEG